MRGDDGRRGRDRKGRAHKLVCSSVYNLASGPRDGSSGGGYGQHRFLAYTRACMTGHHRNLTEHRRTTRGRDRRRRGRGSRDRPRPLVLHCSSFRSAGREDPTIMFLLQLQINGQQLLTNGI